MQMKEYRISDLFEKVEVQKIQGKANDFPTMKDETHTIPLLTSAGNNQGFKSLLKQQTLSKKAAHQIMLQYHTINLHGLGNMVLLVLHLYEVVHLEHSSKNQTWDCMEL